MLGKLCRRLRRLIRDCAVTKLGQKSRPAAAKMFRSRVDRDTPQQGLVDLICFWDDWKSRPPIQFRFLKIASLLHYGPDAASWTRAGTP
jgi:hypothetical protein